MTENYSLTCKEAQQKLVHIKGLERELDELLDRLVDPSINLRDAQEYKIEVRRIKTILESEITALQEQVNPFERLFNLKEQYKSQIDMLEIAKILETREINGEEVKGIVDIEGDFHQVPTLKEVISRLREKKELLTLKQTQGFGKIRLIPFGMSLDELAERYKQVLLDHYVDKPDPNDSTKRIPDENKTKLWGHKYNIDRTSVFYYVRTPLELNREIPLLIKRENKNADTKGNLVYHPKEFTIKDHGGKTKSEILKKRKEQNKSAWDIIILENDVNIPREGNGKIIGARKQIEANKRSDQYLQLLQTESYRGEVGITPEETFIHAITELVENNEVIDFWNGKGSISYIVGAYYRDGLPSWATDFGLVPSFFFSRDANQAVLTQVRPISYDEESGIRSGVRV